MDIKIRCAHQKMMPVNELLPHPKNPNKHTDEQISRLAQIIEYQGFRSPIKVSLASGYITAGHGRLEAAKKLGMEKVPVDFQEYNSEDQEYADIVSDNSIASWADLDLSAINANLENMGPDFDIEMLGLENFHVEPAELNNKSTELSEADFQNFQHKCPKCDFEWNDA